MWEKCKKYLTGGVVGGVVAFIIAFSVVKSLLHIPEPIISTPEKTVVVKLVTKIDTVWRKQLVTEYRLLEQPTIVQTDTVKDIEKKVVTIPAVKRVYSDSVKVSDSVYIGYKAHTTGTLDNIRLNYHNNKSIVVIHKTDSVNTTTTIKQYPAGLFIGLDAGYNQITPKLEYVKNKNSFSAGFNIITKTPQIGYSRRIF